MARKRWGVDSAAPADAALLKCVETSYGFPSYWGRYLTETQGSGLTKKEIQFLQSKEIKILPIYNVFMQAISYENGWTAARCQEMQH